jgi:hypothetical protein
VVLFLAGLFVGANVGLLVASLLCAASKRDHDDLWDEFSRLGDEE